MNRVSILMLLLQMMCVKLALFGRLINHLGEMMQPGNIWVLFMLLTIHVKQMIRHGYSMYAYIASYT